MQIRSNDGPIQYEDEIKNSKMRNIKLTIEYDGKDFNRLAEAA